MNNLYEKYQEVWLVDFEFSAPPGETPSVVCMVALELKSGKKLRLWRDELMTLTDAPFRLDEDVLYVAYYASAEFNCHLSLGWQLPLWTLDLFTEFRNLTNGRRLISGASLLGAMSWYGLDCIETAEKDSMRELIMSGGPWSDDEKQSILDYCESDVAALSRLLPEMLPFIDLERAMYRGDYMKSVAEMEFNGVPLDTTTLNKLLKHWDRIQDKLIESVDSDFGVYEGRSFKTARFRDCLSKRNIPWPTLPSGQLDLKKETFKDMARSHPELAPLHDLRVSLSQMRLSELAVGSDGRNRCLLSPFRSRTGRNQPSNSRFIFGPAVWLRSLIKPEPGTGLAYIDWSQQEFGIAAALSGDKAMQEAYRSGDPYLAFAKQAGAVPSDATKKTHPAERELYKACVLAVQYGMGADSLARKIGKSIREAKSLLEDHKQTFKDFWKWSDAVLDYAMLHGELWTVYGWKIHVGENPNPRFLRNFLMQANGAELLRYLCSLLSMTNTRVCATVHDAVLIEAPLDELDKEVDGVQRIMKCVSSYVLDGFTLRSDAELIRFPDRYTDKRGRKMWMAVQNILCDLDDSEE